MNSAPPDWHADEDLWRATFAFMFPPSGFEAAADQVSQIAETFRLRHWIYSGQELRHMLLDAGFATVDLFGDLTGAPYDQNAKRLVAVARKIGP